ncbi:hypothetical protein [Aestuariivirga sp.]|uniref:hypothetical protein n=1 Tax=Aestuariivirga sp. TaxID=2650926 RepID=UPI003BA90438
MTAKERELVLALAARELSKDDFLTRFRGSTDGQKLCGELLAEAIKSQVPEDVECALIVGFVFGFTDDHLDMLLELASAPWHFRHEDVVEALSESKSPKSIEALRVLTKWIPDYLDFDESRALAVKAIWALGSITGTEADAALSELVNDLDPILAESAAEQIKRRAV